MQVGKTDYAIACLERALTIRNDDEETRYRLAQAYAQKDRLEDAAEQFEHLCLLAPDNAVYPLSLADLCFQQELYDEMEQACRRALDINPELAMPHYLLAKKAFSNGEWAQAADECTEIEQVIDLLEQAQIDYASRMKKILQKNEYSVYVRHAIDYIYDHLHEPITMESLARRKHLSYPRKYRPQKICLRNRTIP